MEPNFVAIATILKSITTATKRLLETREEFKINEVAINLQGVVLDLQSEMAMIQANYQNILRTRDDLEKKLIEQENWDKERSRYHLERVGASWWAFVYALNVRQPSIEPPHWLCAHCYEDKKKSILQSIATNKYFCARCKTQLLISGFPE